jgi:hypothetical protein
LTLFSGLQEHLSSGNDSLPFNHIVKKKYKKKEWEMFVPDWEIRYSNRIVTISPLLYRWRIDTTCSRSEDVKKQRLLTTTIPASSVM